MRQCVICMVVITIAVSMVSCRTGSSTAITTVGVRKDKEGEILSAIVEKALSVAWYTPVSPDGPEDWETTTYRYYLESNGARKELGFLRGDSNNIKPRWSWFFPVEEEDQWIGFSQNAPQMQMVLLNSGGLIRHRVLPVVRGEDRLMDDPRPKLLDMDHREFIILTMDVAALADLHLFDGNSKVLYRSITTNVQYHVYDVVRDVSEDISLEQCSEIKKSAPDIAAVVDARCGEGAPAEP